MPQHVGVLEAPQECVGCHTDVHQQTVGMDCARCHDTRSWIVADVTDLHQQDGFALLGAHATADCQACHVNPSMLRFDPIDPACITCHQEDFQATTKPDHTQVGFSTNCTECHNMNAFAWVSDGFNHDFFPLTKGHAIDDCARCHVGNDYTNISPDCISCHEQDFQATVNPDHIQAGFATDCKTCHTTDPGWKPANFREHDAQYFPIYSGTHAGTWDACATCHIQDNNYAAFSCIECHEHNQPATDKNHEAVAGYSYSATACLACHPTGEKEEVFDHSKTNFPLTGAHTTLECLSCHANGFTGTPTECVSCHQDNFVQTTNPNHQQIGLSTDCASCHTTEPGWSPASMPNHNDFFALNGAHAAAANDCAGCHHEDFNNTPNTCVGCHQADYEQTQNPSHAATGFSTDCASCHSEAGWRPAAFDHDAQYFPIYSGAHQGAWDACAACHTNASNFAIVSCIDCHEHNQPDTDTKHQGVAGYAYSSSACLACHPTGSADGAFDHNQTNFPLTGAHLTVACVECHADGYTGTPTTCVSCHQTDFNQTTDPNHQQLGLSSDCATCHTTQPGWSPAQFPIHDEIYALTGAHAAIANDCASCHANGFANTPNTCAGCHIDNYNATTNPNHQQAGFSTNCATCHTESAWTPVTNFDHNKTNFPLRGAHTSVACAQCHTNGYSGTPTACVSCHQDDYNATTDPNHKTSGFSTDCASCHSESAWQPANFDHNKTNFPLRGAHTSVACAQCHTNGYSGTPTACVSCHQDNYNATTDPNHKTSGFSTDCASCHSESAWQPANFDHNKTTFPLRGAHSSVACAQCHTNGYTGTPTACVSCHQDDYNSTIDPNHKTSGFSTDCKSCHSETAWQPANFDHNKTAFPLRGAHSSVACAQCHTNGYTGTPTACVSCHQDDFNATTDPNHKTSGFSTDCKSCHLRPPGNRLTLTITKLHSHCAGLTLP
ncbi:MAG: hypothetical protein R2806_05605 [Saprospiraceae bacterium]